MLEDKFILEAISKRAVADEHNRIRRVIYENGYDWSNDKYVSGLQHFLNWLAKDDRENGTESNYA
jgi:hypothetical protein